MNEPRYAAHERIALRIRDLPEGSPDHTTALMYDQILQHVIRTYPESGPLRSVALRKLAESLIDVLDHAALTREPEEWKEEITGVSPVTVHQMWKQVDPSDGDTDADGAISNQ